MGASAERSTTIPQVGVRATARRDRAITEIAARHLGLDTLDARGCDRLDFHDLSTWAIRDALEAAYAAGAASVAIKERA